MTLTVIISAVFVIVVVTNFLIEIEYAHKAPLHALIGAAALCISYIPVRKSVESSGVRLIFNGMLVNTAGAASVLAAYYWLLSAGVDKVYEFLGLGLSVLSLVALNLAVVLISVPRLVSRFSRKRR